MRHPHYTNSHSNLGWRFLITKSARFSHHHNSLWNQNSEEMPTWQNLDHSKIANYLLVQIKSISYGGVSKIWQRDINDYHKSSFKSSFGMIIMTENGIETDIETFLSRGSLIFTHIAPLWFHWIMNMMQISYKSWNCKYKSVGSIFKTHVTVVTYYCKLSFLCKVIDSLQR